MALLWTEDELISIDGKVYLNHDTTKRIYNRYNEKMKIADKHNPNQNDKIKWGINDAKKIIRTFSPNGSSIKMGGLDEFTKRAIDYYLENYISKENTESILFNVSDKLDKDILDKTEKYEQLGTIFSELFPNFTFNKVEFNNLVNVSKNIKAISECTHGSTFVALSNGSFSKLRANLLALSGLREKNFSSKYLDEIAFNINVFIAKYLTDDDLELDKKIDEFNEFIVFFSNNGEKDVISEIMARICKRYGLDNIDEYRDMILDELTKIQSSNIENSEKNNEQENDALENHRPRFETLDELDDSILNQPLSIEPLNEFDDSIPNHDRNIESLDVSEDNSNIEEEEETYSIISRIKGNRKKIVYSSLAGVGIISCLYLTFVAGLNPLTVITNCASSFGNLISGNATLGALAKSIGDFTAYFGGVVAGLTGVFKLTKKESKENDSTEEASKDESNVEESKIEDVEELDEEDEDLSVLDEESSILDEEDLSNDISDNASINIVEVEEFEEVTDEDLAAIYDSMKNNEGEENQVIESPIDTENLDNELSEDMEEFIDWVCGEDNNSKRM